MKKINEKKLKTDLRAVVFCCFILLVASVSASCSSAPKRTMERNSVREVAYDKLELAVSDISKNNLASAENNLQTSYSLALSIDNAELLLKVCLTRVTFALSLDEGNPEEILQEAEQFAQRCENPELSKAICSLYRARILISGKEDEPELFKKALELCVQNEKTLGKEAQYLAYLYRTKGEIYLLQKKYAEAGNEFEKAAGLHIKERYLSEIALDYYYLARAQFYAGKKTDALKALENALKYDRLDENTNGLGSDYYAMALVLNSENATAEEKKLAERNALYSAQIFEAGGFLNQAEKSRSYAKEIKDSIKE